MEGCSYEPGTTRDSRQLHELGEAGADPQRPQRTQSCPHPGLALGASRAGRVTATVEVTRSVTALLCLFNLFKRRFRFFSSKLWWLLTVVPPNI